MKKAKNNNFLHAQYYFQRNENVCRRYHSITTIFIFCYEDAGKEAQCVCVRQPHLTLTLTLGYA